MLHFLGEFVDHPFVVYGCEVLDLLSRDAKSDFEVSVLHLDQDFPQLFVFVLLVVLLDLIVHLAGLLLSCNVLLLQVLDLSFLLDQLLLELLFD